MFYLSHSLLLPKSGGRRMKNISAVLCSTFNEEMMSSFDKTAVLIAVSTLTTSVAAFVYKLAVAS